MSGVLGMAHVVRNPRRTSPEKLEERAANRLMCDLLGFTRWHLSQARATNQTPGWPDVLYMHAERGLAVYYEAKAPKGKQSDAQREFEREARACGMTYLVGTHDVLIEWARTRGLIR